MLCLIIKSLRLESTDPSKKSQSKENTALHRTAQSTEKEKRRRRRKKKNKTNSLKELFRLCEGLVEQRRLQLRSVINSDHLGLSSTIHWKVELFSENLIRTVHLEKKKKKIKNKLFLTKELGTFSSNFSPFTCKCGHVEITAREVREDLAVGGRQQVLSLYCVFTEELSHNVRGCLAQ